MYSIIDFLTLVSEVFILLLLLYVVIWIWILPMNRVRLLCDNFGFAHLSGTAKKREIINRLRKTRFQGKIPPAFPNGWYALAESREVFNENNAFTVFPHIVSALEYFPPLNSFCTFMYCDLWPYVL